MRVPVRPCVEVIWKLLRPWNWWLEEAGARMLGAGACEGAGGRARVRVMVIGLGLALRP